MKLLILSFYFTPDLSAGSFRVQALCNELIKNFPNTEVDLLTTQPNRYSSYSKSAPASEKFGNINIIRFDVGKHSGNMIGQIVSFIRYSLKVCKKVLSSDYEIVFATSSRLMTALLGAVISKKISASLYLDIRDLFLDTVMSLYSAKSKILLFPILNVLEKYTFSKAHKINLVSEGFKDYVSKKYPTKELSFFTNGIDDLFLPMINSIADESSGIEMNNDNIKVLYAGNIGEGQAIDKIIPDLSESLGNKYEFIIIGDGSRKQNLKKVINEKNLKNIIVLDPMHRKELMKYYIRADILFLHLDKNIAFKKVLPSKIFEYAVTGKPILAGVAGYPAVFIKKFVTNAQVFLPCSVNDASELIHTLDLSLQPRHEFARKFSRSTIMKELAKDIFVNSSVNTFTKNNDV